MSEGAAPAPLVQQVLEGSNRELQRLAASGILPLPPEELIPLQVGLARIEDGEVARLATESLRDIEPRVVCELLREGGKVEVLEFFVEHASHPSVVEVILQRRDVSASMLRSMAPSLSPDLQEILLLRQDLIVEDGEILKALEGNPDLSTYSVRKIKEYREHLLAERKVAPRAEPEPADEEEGLTEEELAAAMEEVQDVEPAGESDPETGLSESQIKAMSPSLRMKLARGASRTLRSILIKDQNPNVACAVLTASAITEQEVEQASANRQMVEEVLSRIATKREWIRKYTIMHNLVKNPRTPVPIAIRQIPRLSLRDLGLLRGDRNVPDAVRQQAARLFRAKTMK